MVFLVILLIKRVSLFREAIGFSYKRVISDEYRIPYGLDVGDIDRDGKNDVVSLSFNYNNPSNNNFIWNRQFSGDAISLDSKGEVIATNYFGE